jgi:transposase
MTKTQVEVITSVQRRRRWSRAEKERIVAGAIEPGAVASEVARAAGIHVSQLFRWRQQLRGAAAAAPVFSPPEKNQQPTMEFIARCHEGVNWRPKFDN